MGLDENLRGPGGLPGVGRMGWHIPGNLAGILLLKGLGLVPGLDFKSWSAGIT